MCPCSCNLLHAIHPDVKSYWGLGVVGRAAGFFQVCAVSCRLDWDVIVPDLSPVGDLDPMTLKPFLPPVPQIAPHLTPQLTPRPPPLETTGSQSLGKSWRLQRRSSEGKLSGSHWLHLLLLTSHAVVGYVTDRHCRNRPRSKFFQGRSSDIYWTCWKILWQERPVSGLFKGQQFVPALQERNSTSWQKKVVIGRLTCVREQLVGCCAKQPMQFVMLCFGCMGACSSSHGCLYDCTVNPCYFLDFL